MVISKKTIIFHGFRGESNFFQGGSNFFQGGGGGQMLISTETHITCDFPGGVQTPSPPSGIAHVKSFFFPNILNQDQVLRFFGPDLDPNCHFKA